MLDESLRRALLTMLGPRPTSASRRSFAATLRAMADEQDRLADADEHVGHLVRRSQLENQPRKGGRPKGTGARFVRLEPPNDVQRTWRWHIGRALWQELGEPKRLDVQQVNGVITLRPTTGDFGYSLNQSPAPGGSMPRFSIGTQQIENLGLEASKYAAEIRDGAIVVGAKLD